jgi:hypothetical protein
VLTTWIFSVMRPERQSVLPEHRHLVSLGRVVLVQLHARLQHVVDEDVGHPPALPFSQPIQLTDVPVKLKVA